MFILASDIRFEGELPFEHECAFAVSGFAAEGIEAVFDGSLNFDGVGVQGGDSGFAAL